MNLPDDDGYHIRTLILSFLLLYCKPLLDAGRVYSAVPPLVGLKTGTKTVKNKKGKSRKVDQYEYFVDKLDFVKYNQRIFAKNYNLTNLRGTKYTNVETTDLLFRNADYCYEVDLIADHYSLNPLILELALIHRNDSFTKFKKTLTDRYRFLEISKKGDTIIIDGLANDLIQTMFLNKKLIDECKNVIDFIDRVNGGEIYHIMNGEHCSLYQVMTAYTSSNPDNIVRYKGLGVRG